MSTAYGSRRPTPQDQGIVSVEAHTTLLDRASEETRVIGESLAIRRAVSLARQLAPTDLPILLMGATGTGKELFAEEIHRWSGRPGVVLDVNCGGLPRELVEALLFGHRRGSFTGAIEHAVGLIERADGGTLFLDELLSLPVEAQPKLLRVLETGEIRRVGETTKRQVRLRTVAAVQDDMPRRLSEGRFRVDLLQRLAGAVIELPPLADRGDDVILLAKHFGELRKRTLAEGAGEVLREYPWPGNVRELRLTIERACYLCGAAALPAAVVAESIDLGASVITKGVTEGARDRSTVAASLRDRVLAICSANNWNAVESASALGLSRTTFFKQLKALGVSLREERYSIDSRTLRYRLP